ncbi:MAG: two-component regulator propeller domain-containing protein, partial [Caldilineaceae bacterium]
MSCILGRRALGALAVWFFIVAATLPGYSHVSAQAKQGAGHGRTTGDDQYIAIPITGLPDKMIWAVAFDSEDRPWLGTNHGGATQQDDGTWRWLTTADGLTGEAVKAYLFPFDGSTWIGTDRAVDVFATPQLDEKSAEYTWSDGLAASAAEDLAVDADGNIWAAHLAEGVSRFDGEQWRKFTIDDGLADNWVYSVAADSAGKVWFGTLGGASVYDGETWTTYSSEDGLAGDWVSDVAIAPNGHIWFATDGGVSEYDGETWKTHLDGQHARSVAAATDGTVWAAGSGFVSYFDGSAWHAVQPAYFADQLLTVLALRAKGEVWVGSLEDGATILSAVGSDSTQTQIDGTLWLGTPAGVTMLQGSEQHHFDMADGLAGNDVRAILIDSEGRKWFGTDGGASMYDGLAWTSYYPSYSSISSNYVHAVAVDPQGRTWFAYGDRGLGASVKDGDEWLQYTADDGLASENIYSMAFGPRGQTWLGTAHGVSQLNGTRWVNLSADAGGPDGKITALAVSPAGYLWAGYDGGVAKYDGSAWTSYSAADGLAAALVSAIAFDQSGRAWAGAAPDRATGRAGGLFVLEDGSWREVAVNRTRSGAGGPATQPLGDWITALAVDAGGQLWVGARSYPLAKPGFVVGGISVRAADAPENTAEQASGAAWTVFTPGNGPVSDYVTAVAGG